MVWILIASGVVAIVLTAIAAAWLCIGRCERCILYENRRYTPPELFSHLVTLEKAGYNCREIPYSTSHGLQLAYYVYPVHVEYNKLEKRIGQGRLWLLFGGKSSLALEWSHVLSNVNSTKSGARFLLIEYPGYGKSKGSSSPGAILEATQSAVTTLCHRLGYGNHIRLLAPMGVIGHSLGCAAALQWVAYITERRPWLVDRIVLLAPFTSIVDMAHVYVGRIRGLAYLVRHPYDNRQYLSHILNHIQCSLSIYILHGKEDDVVPVQMGQSLAVYLRNRVSHDQSLVHSHYHPLDEADHCTILQHALPLLQRIIDT